MMHSNCSRWFSVSGWIGMSACAIGALSACGDVLGGGDEEKRNKHYVAAEEAFEKGCGSASNDCHAKGGDGDDFASFSLTDALAAGDIRSAMVNVPSCEYDLMGRIEPGDPGNSWIMVKITAPFVDDDMTAREYGNLIFEPDPSWSAEGRCASDVTGFGKRMPSVGGFEMPERFRTAVRTWIEQGAPGPNGELSAAGM